MIEGQRITTEEGLRKGFLVVVGNRKVENQRDKGGFEGGKDYLTQ